MRASGVVLAVAACGVAATGDLPVDSPLAQAAGASAAAAAVAVALLAGTPYRSWQLGDFNVEVRLCLPLSASWRSASGQRPSRSTWRSASGQRPSRSPPIVRLIPMSKCLCLPQFSATWQKKSNSSKKLS